MATITVVAAHPKYPAFTPGHGYEVDSATYAALTTGGFAVAGLPPTFSPSGPTSDGRDDDVLRTVGGVLDEGSLEALANSGFTPAGDRWQARQSVDPWAGSLLPFGTGAINEFTCAGTTGVAIAVDDAVTFGGRPTTRVTFGGTASETNFQLGISGAAVQVRGIARDLLTGFVAVAVKGTVPATALVLYVGDADYTNYWEVAINADNNSVVVDIGDGWKLFFADATLPGVVTAYGTPTLDGAKRMKIRCFSDTPPAAGSMWVGFAGVVRKPRATVVLTCDDGFSEWVDYLWPAMAARDIPGSFSIDAGYIGQPGFLTDRQARQALEQYSPLIEFVNHGADNEEYSPGVNLAQYTNNILRCDALLQSWGVPEASRKQHAYVQGFYDQALINWLVANGFNSAREVGASNRSQFMVPAHLSTPNVGRSSLYAVPAGCNLSSGQPVSTVIDYIEEAKRRGSAFFIMGHEFKAATGALAYVAGYHQTHGMSNLLDYLAAERDAGNINLATWSGYVAGLRSGRPVTGV